MQENKLGRYEILDIIATGGMGEILLAYDPACSRKIAIKKIKDELMEKPSIPQRFFKEAKIASQLIHPSILPIYSIHDEDTPYYTMPYIEGKTLKQLIEDAKTRLQAGLVVLAEHSIMAFMHLFLAICEGVAYVHEKNILHRDLKPENILTGKFGEVFILDWGIATIVGEKDADHSIDLKDIDYALTKPGKIAGTLSHLAPERAFSKPASVQTDIYALGVILYQILTLIMPFKRKDLKTFKKTAIKEQLKDPIEIAPLREIPFELSAITKRCLSFYPEDRYTNVKALIHDIKTYIEGRPKWIHLHNLNMNRIQDWEFQENVFLAKNVAITRHMESTDWFTMMVSKNLYQGNLKLSTKIRFNEHCQGIGFLFCLPEVKSIDEGYCFWISPKKQTSKLLKAFVGIKDLSFLQIEPNKTYRLSIEKVDHHLYLYLDECYLFSFNTYLPIKGQKIGLLIQDAHFALDNLEIFTNTTNLMVSCLSIPDNFFQKNQFDNAIEEYRKISYSFPGRTERSEAIFRTGLTLVEKAKTTRKIKEKIKLFNEALDEFSRLHKSFYEPLEYLGKSIVYATQKEFEEESKCLELALRKFAHHPLLEQLHEHIIYRCHESSSDDRLATYYLIWIALRFIPQFISHFDIKKLLENLIAHWEILPYFPEQSFIFFDNDHLLIELAYRLEKIPSILEMIQLNAHNTKRFHLFYKLLILLQLKANKEVKKLLKQSTTIQALEPIEVELLTLALDTTKNCKQVIEKLCSTPLETWNEKHRSLIFYYLECALEHDAVDEGLAICCHFDKADFAEKRIFFDRYFLHLLLLKKDLVGAKNIIEKFPTSTYYNESFPLHDLYGCYLLLSNETEKANAFFQNTLDKPHPFSDSLLSYFFSKKMTPKAFNRWQKEAFSWERKKLNLMKKLYANCINKNS